MEPLGDFIAACLKHAPGQKEQARTVYQAFLSWCLANNERPWKKLHSAAPFRSRG